MNFIDISLVILENKVEIEENKNLRLMWHIEN